MSAKPLASVSVVCLLASCASVGPDFVAPAPPAATRYTEAALPADTAEPVERWWTLFESPALDALVTQALAASPSLDEAAARLRQAQQLEAADRHGAYWPQADLGVSSSRQRNDPSVSGIAGVPGSVFSLHGVTLDVRYEIDLAGRRDRVLEASSARVAEAVNARDAARAMLAANVVTAALNAAALDERIALLQRQVELQRSQLAITHRQVELGAVAAAQRHAQQGLLAQTEARLPPLRAQRAAWRHRLALYLGRAPTDGLPALPAFGELRLPAAPAVGVPATLVSRRPDLRASEARLRAANARIGIAGAELYPRLMVSSSAASQRQRLGDLADGLNLWSVGLRLVQPLLDRPALKARQGAAVAEHEAAAAAHRQAVLRAVGEVADALHAVDESAQQLQAQSTAAEQAEARAAIARERLRLGALSDLEALDAQRQALQAALARADAAATRQLDTAALLQALGGRWSSAP